MSQPMPEPPEVTAARERTKQMRTSAAIIMTITLWLVLGGAAVTGLVTQSAEFNDNAFFWLGILGIAGTVGIFRWSR